MHEHRLAVQDCVNIYHFFLFLLLSFLNSVITPRSEYISISIKTASALTVINLFTSILCHSCRPATVCRSVGASCYVISLVIYHTCCFVTSLTPLASASITPAYFVLLCLQLKFRQMCCKGSEGCSGKMH